MNTATPSAPWIRLYPSPDTSEVSAESTDLSDLLVLPATEGARIIHNGVVLARSVNGAWKLV